MVEYSIDVVNKILEEIIAGKSVAEICKQDGFPAESNFYVWLGKNLDNIQERYAHAREQQAEKMVQEMHTIADNCLLTAEAINKARLQIDTRKWSAAHLKPKKYGERATIDHTGTVTVEQLILERPKTIERQPALPVIEAITTEK